MGHEWLQRPEPCNQFYFQWYWCNTVHQGTVSWLMYTVCLCPLIRVLFFDLLASHEVSLYQGPSQKYQQFPSTSAQWKNTLPQKKRNFSDFQGRGGGGGAREKKKYPPKGGDPPPGHFLRYLDYSTIHKIPLFWGRPLPKAEGR